MLYYSDKLIFDFVNALFLTQFIKHIVGFIHFSSQNLSLNFRFTFFNFAGFFRKIDESKELLELSLNDGAFLRIGFSSILDAQIDVVVLPF